MTKCSSCNNYIPDDATECKHCGLPTGKQVYDPNVDNSTHTPASEQTVSERDRQMMELDKKSPLTAFMLALFFGPIGVMYANITVGLIMLVLTIAIGLSIPVVGLVVMWIANMIVATGAADKHNERLALKYGIIKKETKLEPIKEPALVKSIYKKEPTLNDVGESVKQPEATSKESNESSNMVALVTVAFVIIGGIAVAVFVSENKQNTNTDKIQ